MALTDVVASSALDVLKRNAQDIDSFTNNTSGSVVTRTGDILTPLPVLNQQAQSAIANFGYVDKGTFTAGATLTAANEILSDGTDYWRWSGAFPKVVTAGSSPTPSGFGAWLNIGDSTKWSELAAVDSAQLIGGVTAGQLAKQTKFLVVTPPSGDAGAFFNGLIAAGVKTIFCAAGDYTFQTSMVASSVTLKILGAGKSQAIFKRGASLGTANIITGTEHDLEIESIGFDLGKGTCTPSLADSTLENAINSTSPTRLKVSGCDFKNLVHRGIVVNGTALIEATDINVTDNTASNGSRGFVMVRRYASNVHVDRNRLDTVIDSALGGTNFDKPIEVSGSHDVSICDNVVSSSNGEGGPIIVEYIDRESVNVHIERNSYYGSIAESYYKVGASSNVWFKENHGSGGAQIGAYFEGCENVWVVDNRLVNTTQNSLVLAQDADTSRYCKKFKIHNNHFVDANTANNTAGVPYTSTGNNGSYHVWVQDNSEDIELRDNKYIKGTNVAGGVLIASPSYTIKGDDFSLLDVAAVTINNSFSPVGAKYKIVDNINCQTTDSGDVTISGAATATIAPKIVAHYNPYTLLSLKTALSGSVAYVFADPDSPPNMIATCKDAAHANATPSSAVTLSWAVDCSTVAKNIFGKTA